MTSPSIPRWCIEHQAYNCEHSRGERPWPADTPPARTLYIVEPISFLGRKVKTDIESTVLTADEWAAVVEALRSLLKSCDTTALHLVIEAIVTARETVRREGGASGRKRHMSEAEDRITHAERAAAEAQLSGPEVASLQAYLLGALLTHFDEVPAIPLTDSRWRRLVREGIEDARRDHPEPTP